MFVSTAPEPMRRHPLSTAFANQRKQANLRDRDGAPGWCPTIKEACRCRRRGIEGGGRARRIRPGDGGAKRREAESLRPLPDILSGTLRCLIRGIVQDVSVREETSGILRFANSANTCAVTRGG